MVNIASPTFEGVNEDEVSKLDAYGKVTTEVKNALKSNALDFKDNVKGNIDKALGGNKFSDKVKGTSSLLRDGVNKVNQAKDLRERINNAIKGDRSALLGITDSILSDMNQNLFGIDSIKGVVQKADTIVRDVTLIQDGIKRVVNGDANKIGAILGLLDNVSHAGFNDIVDMGVYTSFASEMVDEMQSWGLPEFLDPIFKATKNEDDVWEYLLDFEYRFEVGRNIGSKIVEFKDLDWLNRLMDHTTPEALKADRPSLPEDLLKGYELPKLTVPGSKTDQGKTYGLELEKLENTLSRLKPDWLEVKRDDKKVWNLDTFANLSDDAKTLLSSDPKYAEMVYCAEGFQPELFKDLAKDTYPNVPF